MIVTVLGMHRSGTSVVTRMMNLLGVYLGPSDRLFGARADNPKGFWEHRDIVRINNDILARLGGSWRHLPSFPKGWECAPELDELKERARTVIKRDFAEVSMWGWKDPSTSLVLPFWQQILPSMHYIICLRNPIDSARSLQKRENLSLEECLDQWFRHVLAALQHTAGLPRILISYEEVMQDWFPVLQRIAQFLGILGDVNMPEVLEQMEEFIDPGLQHYQTSVAIPKELDLPVEVVGMAVQAYNRLQQPIDEHQLEVEQLLINVLKIINPIAELSRERANERWLEMTSKAADEITTLAPPGDALILVDDNELGREIALGRKVLLFLEDRGNYIGPPPDDATAILELEHMREAGANHIIITWPAFWWLEHYVQFYRYLQSHFHCVKANERLVAFCLDSQLSE